MDSENKGQPNAGQDQSSSSGTSGQQTDSGWTGSGQSENESSLSDELFQELTILGSRLVEVAQTAWNSEDRKQIQSDLKEGLSSVAGSLEEGFQKVVDNEQAKEVIDKADETAESVGKKLRSSQAVNDLGASLVKGLSLLTSKLEKWTEEMSASNTDADSGPTATRSPADSDSQDIPIDKG